MERKKSYQNLFLIWLAKILVLLLAVVALIFSFFSTKSTPLVREIHFVVDFSHSMNAKDGKCMTQNCSRLQNATEILQRIIEHTPGYEYGLIGFAGQARVLVPTTTQSGFILDTLSGQHSFLFDQGGTNLAEAVRLAVSGAGSGALLIILTDGGEDGENVFQPSGETVNMISTKQMRSLIMGFGGLDGSSVILPNGKTLFVNNKEQLTKRNDSALSQLSSQLDGYIWRQGDTVERLLANLDDNFVSSSFLEWILLLVVFFLFLGL